MWSLRCLWTPLIIYCEASTGEACSQYPPWILTALQSFMGGISLKASCLLLNPHRPGKHKPGVCVHTSRIKTWINTAVEAGGCVYIRKTSPSAKCCKMPPGVWE
jgi:hypothetical protein